MGNSEAQGDGPLAARSASTLTREDVENVRSLSTVAAASASVPTAAMAGTKTIPMTGVDPSYAQIRSVDLAAGRFVEHSGEVVLESAVAKDLLNSGPKDAVGKTLKIRGKSFEVVGVLEVVEPAFSPPVPETSYMNTGDALALSGAGNVGQIVAEARSAGSVDQAATPTSSHPQAKIKVRSTRIKIRSRWVPLASQRGAEVLTYARMVMSHQKFAMVQEAARASHLGAGEPPVSSPTGRPR